MKVHPMRHHRVVHHLNCHALARGDHQGVTSGQYLSFSD
jgi:hypothetical protein